MYVAASAVGVEQRIDWVDPSTPSVQRYSLLDDALPFHVWSRARNVWGVNLVYAKAVEKVMPRVRSAAVEWAVKMLDGQQGVVGHLQIVVGQQPELLHKLAKKARDEAKVLWLTGSGMTSAEAHAVLDQDTKERRTVWDRLTRAAYMRTVKNGKDKEPSEHAWSDLLTLMAHPKGVAIVDAFAESAETGRELTTELVDECAEAILELRRDLRHDESIVWRFPPAVTAGVTRLARPRPAALTGFALLWARVEGSRTEGALDVAGNAIFALQLVGGPIGAVIGEVLDFVLSVISASVAFLHSAQQDQAAGASTFAADADKLSRGSSRVGAVLVGLAAIAAAAALPGTVSQITQRAGRGAKKMVVAMERVPPPTAVPDPRAVSQRGIGSEQAVDVTQRMTDDARRSTTRTTAVADAPPATGTTATTTAVSRSGATNLDASGTKTVTDDRALGSKGTGDERKDVSDTSVGTLPPQPPRKRGTVGYVKTYHPGTDTRTASGGITRVEQFTNLDNRTVVQIQGRIDPVPLGEVPDSIFRDKWPAASTIAPEIKTYERCHLFPLQWGDEAFVGFMYADKTRFNTSVQKRLENAVAELRRLMPPKAELRVTVTAISFKRDLRESKWGNVLEELSYRFEIVGTEYRTRIDFDVGPPPNGRIELAAPFAKD